MNGPLISVVMPTVGDPEILLPAVMRMLECTEVQRWTLYVVVNPVEQYKEMVEALSQQIDAAVELHNATSGRFCELRWIAHDGPIGWPRAVNSGVRYALDSEEEFDAMCVINDDVLVTDGWLSALYAALQPPGVKLQGELANYREHTPVRDPAAYGRIGMVGPVSNVVAGAQKIVPPDVKMGQGSAFRSDGSTLLSQFGQQLRDHEQGMVMSTTFLSGLCVLYSRDCLTELWEDCINSNPNELVSTNYGVGGYDDNDVAVRVQHLGFKPVIARGVYVHHLGHQTLAPHFPEANLGLSGLVPYLRTWEDLTGRDHQRLVAVYRMGWDVPWDVAMLGSSLRRTMQLCDGVALLATTDPSLVLNHPQIKAMSQRLPPAERALLLDAQSAKGNAEELTAAITKYLQSVADSLDLDHEVDVRAAVFSNGNERDERNAAIELATLMFPDWCISVDHDEIAEPGVTREWMQRIMRHPDPMVSCYDTGWANHWDSDRVCRVDPPWCNGYRSSMRGYRMWRVMDHGDRILAGAPNGLHCGNVPEVGVIGKRVAGLRWRHYGYLRAEDRVRKWKRYNQIDPQPDEVLTQAHAGGGSGYDHLIREENMRMQPYRKDTRIGLTMLVHSGEELHDVARHLSHSYALVDEIALVWTEPEGTPIPDDWLYVAERYGVKWVLHPLDNDLGTARNAGVHVLRSAGCDWCWVMDPDEHFGGPIDDLISIRRMVEVSDGWAWLFQFRNYRPDGKWSISENVRLFRLAGGVLQYDNRVHETLERSLQTLAQRGIHPQVRTAPFHVEHFGLSGGDEATQAKLQRYTRLLAMQVEDEPVDSAGAWVSLGLQYGNDGDLPSQRKCYDVACATAGAAYLPFREAALYHLRIGKQMMRMALQRLAPAHSLHGQVGDMVKALEKIAPDQPKLGAARAGHAVPADVDLERLLAAAWAMLDAQVDAGHDDQQEG